MEVSTFSILVVFGLLIFIFITIKSLILLINIFITSYCFKNNMSEEICRAIEENNWFHCFQLVVAFPQFINIPRNQSGYTPFMIACASGNHLLVEYMLNRGGNIRIKSNTNDSVFHLAVSYHINNANERNASCLWLLHRAGADINEPNHSGLSPLQIAALFGHTDLVKWLLNKNASLNVEPHPYVIARYYGFSDTAKFIQDWENFNNMLMASI